MCRGYVNIKVCLRKATVYGSLKEEYQWLLGNMNIVSHTDYSRKMFNSRVYAKLLWLKNAFKVVKSTITINLEIVMEVSH